MLQLYLFPQHRPRDVAPLSEEDRQRLLGLLLKGASPAAACGPLGLDVWQVCQAVDCDPAFRSALRQVRDLLTQNVAAAVYRAAMEGTPAAQALWLRTFAPADWADPLPSVSVSDPSELSESPDVFAALPTDALARLAHAFRPPGRLGDDSPDQAAIA